MTRFFKTRSGDPRMTQTFLAISSRRPRLPGGFVRLSRRCCARSFTRRSGLSISGKENCISCYLHKLKCGSKTIPRDASNAPLEINRHQRCHDDAKDDGGAASHSTQHDRSSGCENRSGYDGFGREAFHELRGETFVGGTVEESHRQESPPSQNLRGKKGRVETGGIHRSESGVLCKQCQHKSQCSECTDAAVFHDRKAVLYCPAAPHTVGGVRQPIFMEASADHYKICEDENNGKGRREDGKADVTQHNSSQSGQESDDRIEVIGVGDIPGGRRFEPDRHLRQELKTNQKRAHQRTFNVSSTDSK